jgi:hypothetical protein
MPQPINPVAMGLGGSAVLINQFTGPALGSIIAGVLSIGVPMFTTFYFPILPIFGVLGGIGAIIRGKPIGGLVGLILSLIGGYMSLQASGILGS